jgi:hypothetical protein
MKNTYVGETTLSPRCSKTGKQGRLPLPTLGIARIVGGDAHIAPLIIGKSIFTALQINAKQPEYKKI